jgi:endonuclease-3
MRAEALSAHEGEASGEGASAHEGASVSVSASAHEGAAKIRKRALKIMRALDAFYPEADCTLKCEDPLQLLVSTIMAAQCTDERVNIVAGPLYKKYQSASDFAQADAAELERDIRSIGMYRQKARNIIRSCQIITALHGGKVPASMDELLALPGVGRKTANLVLGDAYGVPGVVVDTHAGRLARRMGLTPEDDPAKVEMDLMSVLPKERWTKAGHQFVLHGRAVCMARGPRCGACAVSGLCPKII